MGHIQLGTVTTFLVCNLCISVQDGLDRKYYNETLSTNAIDSFLINSDIMNHDMNFMVSEKRSNSIIKLRDKRSVTNMTDSQEKVAEEETLKFKNTSNLISTTELEKTSNPTEEEDETVAGTEFSTEDYDQYNMTEEPCVGDPEFCNMTREDYIKMLNDYIYPQPYEWVLIATHAIVFVIGLIGNALVCIAVYRNHSMRTVTNYFIVNLAVADFMVILICLPPTVLWDVTETWFFGTAMCRIVLYFQVKELLF